MVEQCSGRLEGYRRPPYKKLGDGKSAPIRYNYGLFKHWLDKFPSVINTQGKLAARAASALSFFSARDALNQWLFAEVNGEPQDIVVAINSGAFDGGNDPLTYWLTYWEWLAKAARSGRMSPTIDKLLSRIRRIGTVSLMGYDAEYVGAMDNWAATANRR